MTDVSNPASITTGSAATSDSSDASALAHQLQLLNGYSNTVGPGWNFGASLGMQETFNDNILQSGTDRRWDIISALTPSFYAYGDTQRVQLRLNYQPTLEYYARDTSLNQIAQSLNATTDITLWPDHLYLDLRATSGVASTSGSQPGLGFGSNGTSTASASTLSGQTKANTTQYTSYEVSPYFLQSFDTYGTLKLGYTFTQSNSSPTTSVLPIATSSSGSSAAMTGNQELIQFTTGSFMERVTDTVSLTAMQSQNSGGTAGTTTGLTSDRNFASQTTNFSNQVNYMLNRSVTAFGSLGYESIQDGGTNALAIHDITWQIGTTLTPDPRSTLTLSYGRSQGVDSMSANGVYALTARTSVTVSYGETLGTALQSVAQQLSQTSINNNGNAVNSQTGVPITNSNALLGTQNQLYRSTVATIGTTTQFDRDTVGFTAQYAVNTAAGAGSTGSTSGVTATANWTHSIRDGLTLNTSGSYGIHTTGGAGGRSAYAALAASLNYSLTATVNTSLSYAFYELSSTGQGVNSIGQGVNSTGQGGSLYQDIVMLTLTKQF